jgi:hypothetical protein
MASAISRSVLVIGFCGVEGAAVERDCEGVQSGGGAIYLRKWNFCVRAASLTCARFMFSST